MGRSIQGFETEGVAGDDSTLVTYVRVHVLVFFLASKFQTGCSKRFGLRTTISNEDTQQMVADGPYFKI